MKNYVINNGFNADILDREGKSLNVTDEELFKVFLKINKKLTLNHGVNFYEKLFNSIEEYRKINPDIDTEVIGELINSTIENGHIKEMYIKFSDNDYVEEIIKNPINKFIFTDYQNSLISNQQMKTVEELFENENTSNHDRLKDLLYETEYVYYYNDETQVVFSNFDNVPVIRELADYSEQEIIKELVYADYIEFEDIMKSSDFLDKFDMNYIYSNDELFKTLDKNFSDNIIDFNIDKYEKFTQKEIEKNHKIDEQLTEEEKQLINYKYQYEYAYLKEINNNDSIEGKIFNYLDSLENNNYNDIEDILMSLDIDKGELKFEINKMNENIPNLIEIIENEEVIGINSTKLFMYNIVQNYKDTNMIFEYKENINRYDDDSREENSAEKIYGFDLKKYFNADIVDQERKKEDNEIMAQITQTLENNTSYTNLLDFTRFNQNMILDFKYVEVGENSKSVAKRDTQNSIELNELFDKFITGNTYFNEYEVKSNEERLDQIVEKYNEQLFNDDEFNRLSGLSETDSEIIAIRDNGSPFAWDIKSFNKESGYVVDVKNTETEE